MICPSCKKSGPASFKCRSCGAELMRGRYRNDESKGQGTPGPRPAFRTPAAAVAGGGGGAVALDNPYATPRAPAVRADYPAAAGSDALASRGSRLAASLIDGLAAVVILLPALASIFFVGENESLSTTGVFFAAISGIAFLGFAVYQLSMLVREGQTLGKKAMNIRIVNYSDGQIPSAGRLLGMRYIVNSLLGNIPFYTFLDVLLIFGNERRCIHDYLAGTKVVET
ncbi:MAG TPA: RDD family protein [Vicinamibacteria bacterium]|nr:RDD family protein [Vicinamibacteria bacterium]